MKTIIEKVQASHPVFCKEVDNLSLSDLKQRIVSLQQSLQQSEEAKNADESYQQTKFAAKEMAAPYSDIRKAVKLKTQYIIELLKEKGE